MKNQRSSIWTPLLFALTLAIGLFIGYRLQSNAPLLVSGGNEGVSGNGRVEELLRYIEARYVDAPDTDELYEAAISAVIDELDPHSSYIPAEQLQALNESMEGNFEGIGIEFLVVDDTITVVSTLPGGPSETAGLMPGDQIIMVEDSMVTGVNEFNIDPASLMRGVSNTDVSISVRRPGEPELKGFTITRAPIPVYSVDAAYKLNDKTAYVKINRFSATTYDEFVKALEEQMEKGGAEHLVIDLRDNPGGYLQQATKMLSQLFPQKGELLVYTQGRNSRRVDYKTNGRAFYNIRDVAVLVDEGSASASEILAGAVQDHDRGIIVGRRSFGKGLVQEQYPLSDGSALRLTVARYYTPSGRSIQRSYDEGEEEYRGELNERFDSGELFDGENDSRDSSVIYYTDTGHPVFGGGGITPDYFVPLDTSLNNETFLRLRQEVPAYIFQYVRRHPELKQFKTLDEYIARFQPDLDEIIPGLTTRAMVDYEGALEDMPARLRPELSLFFRARLARQLFDGSAFFQVLNEEDPIVIEALRLLEKDDPMAAARAKKGNGL
ncbi:S41 family peptidase [Neolewinella agarilytica]|uniref:Carboxyl-terminal processing protease n=1 Tax=Neolewinella agarilytica TaxID=478744 RepID=A0A1H8ZPC0_9BACT|nr:S41 family peptidase [Neolewinella agarilytica]SEP66366.1 carboxyl-terminal processing protease [Neolewinella agarilytica]